MDEITKFIATSSGDDCSSKFTWKGCEVWLEFFAKACEEGTFQINERRSKEDGGCVVAENMFTFWKNFNFLKIKKIITP